MTTINQQDQVQAQAALDLEQAAPAVNEAPERGENEHVQTLDDAPEQSPAEVEDTAQDTEQAAQAEAPAETELAEQPVSEAPALPASAHVDVTAKSEVSLEDADAIIKASEERRQRVQESHAAERKAKKGPANPLLAKYPALAAVFFKADSTGQITSLFREFAKGEENWTDKFRAKLADYRKALQAGDILVTDDITMREVEKLAQMGVELNDPALLEKCAANTPTRKTSGTGTRAPTANPLLQKYTNLSASFFRGSFKGQLDSVYKTREAHPEKVADFVKACKEADLPLPETYTKVQAAKLAELGLTLPAHLIVN